MTLAEFSAFEGYRQDWIKAVNDAQQGVTRGRH